jgi:hypothetical protein
MPPTSLAQPTREDWQMWVENPVSQWVFQALQTAAEAQRTAWVNQTWGPDLSGEPGRPDPMHLLELKTRADAYVAMAEAPYDKLCELLDQEPKEAE